MEGSVDPFLLLLYGTGEVDLCIGYSTMHGNYLFAMASAVVQESVLQPAQICIRGRQRSMGGAGGRVENENEGKVLPPKTVSYTHLTLPTRNSV